MVETKIHQRFLENLNVRNILDNGGFDIWQRGDGPFTVTEINADRWKQYSPGSKSVSREQVEVKTAGGSSIKIEDVVTTYCAIIQTLGDFRSYEGKTLSLSVWVKASAVNMVNCTIKDNNGVTEERTDGLWNQTTDWEQMTVSRKIRTGLGGSGYITVSFTILAGSTVYLDDVMFVIGDIPVEFVPTLPAEEWNRCQRYYERRNSTAFQIGGYAFRSDKIDGVIFFKVRKVNTPTVTVSTWNVYISNWEAVDSSVGWEATLEMFRIRSDKAAGLTINHSYPYKGDWEAEVT